MRIELGIALAGQGAVDEAVEHGRRALARPRHLVSVLSRARQLDGVLVNRYPTASSVREFNEQYQRFASQALTD